MYDLPADVPRDVSRCLTGLAWRSGRDGFAFSRFARALPLPPPKGEKDALLAAKKMATSEGSAPGWAVDSIRSFVGQRMADCSIRRPNVLPSSSSSCLELSGAKGGINGYFRQLGWRRVEEVSQKFRQDRRNPKRMLDGLLPYCQDSLGTFCCKKVRGDGTFAVADDETIRALGVLVARAERQPTSTRAVALRSAGMKFRVVGVPNALTFMEGDWIRNSCKMLPREHFIPSDGSSIPPSLIDGPRGGNFVSVDLSKATDGLYHNTVEAVVDGLRDAGAISATDLRLVKRGLGLSPNTLWSNDHVGEWVARRGSPMGTPLSFVVLSWVNAWACQAFDTCATHGDDAVGVATSDYQMEEYQIAIEAIGASVNTTKTFVSSHWFTMCEMAGQVVEKGRRTTVIPYYPPSCPAPGLRAPVAAEPRTDCVGLKRSERVMRTLFPWSNRDVRLRLPTEVGGLGYTGRGLAVSKSVRCRLAAACSRRDDKLLAESLSAKRPFREEGLFPKSMVRVPSRPGLFYKAQRAVEQSGDFTILPAGEGELVPLSKLVVEKCKRSEETYLLLGGDVHRKMDRGRPTRTKRSALFKRKEVPAIRPLSKRYGVQSLRSLAATLRALQVRVDPDIAFEILGRTPNPPAS
uniref:RNA-dependent RNA polymerase n=1 Tax=Suillus luteus narnavirus 7 TaxID=3067826 RepID=A0AA49X7Y8_9VIRU|nr:RNA-dependent RNA polymerase [Suillus luteus narnavirus 7]